MKSRNASCSFCHTVAYMPMYPGQDRMFGIPGKFTVIQCLRCGLVRVHPLLTLKTISAYYPLQYYSYISNAKEGLLYQLRSYLILHSVCQTVISSIARFFIRVPAIPTYRKGGKFLDIGCGAGHTLLLFKKIGWKTYGIDIDNTAIRQGKKQGLQNMTRGTYHALRKYPDNYFDAIRLYHVIEHLDDPSLCIALIYKKLKPGGELIIGTPNIDSFLAKIAKQYWYNLDVPRHMHLFSVHTISNVLKKHSFKTDDVYFCSAGGIVGTMQYVISEKFHMNMHLISKPVLIWLLLPIEFILDRLARGDLFVVHAKKL